MAIRTVGLLSPGDMGHSIGAVLKQNGLRVVTSLEGRSARTKQLAAEAGLEDTPSMEALVSESDVLLCVLVPSEAVAVAERVAAALRSTGADLLYADLNAVAPRTARQIGQVITAAGGRYSDGGIIGPPPRRPGTRIYVSGPDAAEMLALRDHGLDVRLVGDQVGQASGLKMCYAALTKGVQALGVELLVAAKAMGLEQALAAEQESTMGEVLRYLQKSTPTMPPKAYRWVGEMEEIATCFEDLGLTPRILLGAADMYRFVADTPIGRESPEGRDTTRGLDGVVAALADELGVKAR